ncbi:MAG: bifunctional metallophosphatase/5'-nucleotidase [Opitutales bacterium]|nr:bifunctional metallophosphatase/5'-nucleotidase [Opitutales bacterium]
MGNKTRMGTLARRRGRREFCSIAARVSGMALAAPWLVSAGAAAGRRAAPGGGTARMLLVHTNDVHDHVRPGFGGMGGLPYVAGHIAAVRAQREDVLLIDAGDVVEKGDLAAYLTRGEMTYRAMGEIGYDAIVPGNHDHNLARDYPPEGWDHVDKLHEFNKLSGDTYVALNLVDRDGARLFPGSREFEVNGIRVGVIGMVLPRPGGTLDFEASGRALAREAARLRGRVHLVVVTCHVGVEDSSKWSRMAPEVDVFVSGHSHEVLHEPVVLEETGAVIVQAGYNALWVGELELEVDLANGGVVDHRGRLVFMCHDTVEPDREMLEWVREKEERVYPGVGEKVMRLERPVGWFGIARLAAEALRVKDGADIGLCHPTHVIRNALPPGPVDVNTLFRTSADRGHPLVRSELTGAEIEAYLNGLAALPYGAWGQTQWAGFRVDENGNGAYTTSLDPDRRYRVILPEREWEKRFMRLVEELRESDPGHRLACGEYTAESVDFAFIDALKTYVRAVTAEGADVHERLEELRAQQGAADPMEERLEPEFERRVEDKDTLAGMGSPRRSRSR